MHMKLLLYLNPLLLAFGAFALFLSHFGWVFLAISGAVYALASYKKTSEHGQWTLAVFLASFWLAHLLSERAPTVSSYPCGRTQGATEGGCEVWSTAGFPFPSLHYFPAGDVPHIGMWPLFFFNAVIFALLSLGIVRFFPKQLIEKRWIKVGIMVLGVLLTLIGEATIMLRFD